jgi:4-amino-4-deoxy-L-arabinose transferase-like glycosyltransferase
MNKIFSKNIIFVILIFFICTLGFFLRYKNYATVPIPGESRDEISFAWLGLSLLETGRPIATSGLDSYSHDWKYINVSDVFHSFANPNPFPIDSFWFDHPPLFSLIPGFYSYTHGVTNFADASISIIRRPMIFLGAFNILLIVIFGALIFNRQIGLIAGLIYATDPLIVISSRLVQAENFLLTIFLLTIIFYYQYRRTQKYFYFWLAISLSGLATLVKLSGISVGLSLLLLTLILESKDKIKKSLAIIFGTGLITLFFPVYGYFYNWKLFLAVFSVNSGRYFRDGLAGFYWLISKTNITRTFLDGWVLLAWFALFFLSTKLLKLKKLWYLIIPVLAYLLVYLIFGSEGYGWYKFPFYPFLFLTLAWVINYFYKKENLFFSLFTLLLAGGVMIDKFFPPEKLQLFMWPFRFGCLFLLTLVLLPSFNLPHFPKKNYSHFMIWLFFIICLLINIWVSLQVTPGAWYQIK